MRARACAVSCVCRPCRNVDAVHVLALRAWANLKKALERTAGIYVGSNPAAGIGGGVGAVALAGGGA